MISTIFGGKSIQTVFQSYQYGMPHYIWTYILYTVNSKNIDFLSKDSPPSLTSLLHFQKQKQFTTVTLIPLLRKRVVVSL